jgi:S-adenosylmethionine synthetase
MKHLFTSESVCAGHPDKICDQISDAIVDAVLQHNPHGRAAIETVASNNQLSIVGEIHTNTKVNFEAIARKQLKRLGYTEPAWGFSDQSPILLNIHERHDVWLCDKRNQTADAASYNIGT